MPDTCCEKYGACSRTLLLLCVAAGVRLGCSYRRFSPKVPVTVGLNLYSLAVTLLLLRLLFKFLLGSIATLSHTMPSFARTKPVPSDCTTGIPLTTRRPLATQRASNTSMLEAIHI